MQLIINNSNKVKMDMPKFKKIYIVTDGASRGNPGPSAIGYGLYDPNWNVIEEQSQYIGKGTNNEAEYRALMAALDKATHYTKDEIEHYSDSELLTRQLKGQYKVRAENLKPLFDKVSLKIKDFKSVKHHHVRRSDKRVQKIDELANQALDKAGK
jgi:ribonuclease HI